MFQWSSARYRETRPVKFLKTIRKLLEEKFVFVALLLSSLEVGIRIDNHLLSPASLTIGLLGTILVVRYFFVAKEALRRKFSMILSLFAFVLVIFLSMVASSEPEIAFRFSLKYLAQILIFLGFMLYFLDRKRAGQLIFIKGVVQFSILNGIISIFEKISVPSVMHFLMVIHHGVLSKNPDRTQGFFQNPNPSGAFGVLGILCLLLYGADIYRTRWIRAGAFSFALAGVILSQSLNGLVNLVFLSVLVFMFSGRAEHNKILVISILSIVILVSVYGLRERISDKILLNPPKQTGISAEIHSLVSLDTRLQIWSSAIRDIKERPLLGMGAGVFIFNTQIEEKIGNQMILIGPGQFDAHNLELNMASGFGLLGFAAFSIFIFLVVRNISGEDAGKKRIILLSIMTLQQIDYFLDIDFSWMLVFWGLLALVVFDFPCLSNQENNEKVRTSSSHVQYVTQSVEMPLDVKRGICYYVRQAAIERFFLRTYFPYNPVRCSTEIPL